MLVRCGAFFFFCLKMGLRRSVFKVPSPPYPREGILDVLARGSIIRLLGAFVELYHKNKKSGVVFVYMFIYGVLSLCFVINFNRLLANGLVYLGS